MNAERKVMVQESDVVDTPVLTQERRTLPPPPPDGQIIDGQYKGDDPEYPYQLHAGGYKFSYPPMFACVFEPGPHTVEWV